jgi:hypothetical protein
MLKGNKMLTKDLENGMVAEFDDGTLGIFLGNTFITYSSGGCLVRSKPDEPIRCNRKILQIIKPTHHEKGGYQASIDFWLNDRKFLDYNHEVIYSYKV